MKITLARCLSFAAICWIAHIGYAGAFESCGPLQNAYGPFDFWTDKDKLPIVEGAHFTPEVESLRSGKSGRLGGDIDYTLRAFPNHPRALFSMMRLGERERTERPAGTTYTIDCYLERAVRFRPNDAMAQLIYGIYLAKHKRQAEALKHLEVAEQFAGDSANVNYNLGLVYLDLGRYDQALKYAHTAYRLGFPLPGLRNRLQEAGRWRDPQPTPPSAVPEEKREAPAE